MDCTTNDSAVTDREIAVTQIPNLYQVLTKVTDGRCARGWRFGSAPVLTAMMVAKMAGEQARSGIAQWVELRLAWLQQVIPLPKAPCANCYRYVCKRIDAGELNGKVADFFAGPQPESENEEASDTVVASMAERGDGEACDAGCSLTPPAPTLANLRHLACDGKELRGSHRFVYGNRQAAQGVFTVNDVSHRYTQALLPLAGKGTEQAVFRVWLRSAELQGCVVTADALHTQSTVCRAIRRRGGEHLLIVKRNQRALHADIDFLYRESNRGGNSNTVVAVRWNQLHAGRSVSNLTTGEGIDAPTVSMGPIFDLGASVLITKAIALMRDGVDVLRTGWIGFDLATQPVHQSFEKVTVPITDGVVGPHALDDEIRRNNAPTVHKEQMQQPRFQLRQTDQIFLWCNDLALDRIEPEVIGLQIADRLVFDIGAAQPCLDLGQEHMNA